MLGDPLLRLLAEANSNPKPVEMWIARRFVDAIANRRWDRAGVAVPVAEMRDKIINGGFKVNDVPVYVIGGKNGGGAQ